MIEKYEKDEILDQKLRKMRMWIYDLWGKGDCWKASTKELKSLLSRRLGKTRFVGIMEAEFESNILVIKEGRVNEN